MKVVVVDGELVLPREATGGGGWHWATPQAHDPRGEVAVVADRDDLSPLSLARLELGGATADDVDTYVAVWVMGELGWLADVPAGSTVRITRRRGRMVVRVDPQHLDYHRASAAAWAKIQRADGRLPVLAVRRGRVRVVALPWSGPVRLVDVGEVLRVAPQYGLADVEHLEVL